LLFPEKLTEQLCGPTSLLANEYKRALSFGAKAPGVKLTHSSPSSTKLNNECIYTSTPQYAFVARCIIMHKANISLLKPCYLLILFHILQQEVSGSGEKYIMSCIIFAPNFHQILYQSDHLYDTDENGKKS
jgi:hypothetical protein